MRPSPELVGLVGDWFSAARGDRSLVNTLVSRRPETLLVGTDPSEIFHGGDAVIDFLVGKVDGAAGNVRFEPADVVAYERGGLGWASARLTITMPDGGQITPRWTAVFSRGDGDWALVHIHASIGITNEQVGWVYPEAT